MKPAGCAQEQEQGKTPRQALGRPGVHQKPQASLISRAQFQYFYYVNVWGMVTWETQLSHDL